MKTLLLIALSIFTFAIHAEESCSAGTCGAVSSADSDAGQVGQTPGATFASADTQCLPSVKSSASRAITAVAVDGEGTPLATGTEAKAK